MMVGVFWLPGSLIQPVRHRARANGATQVYRPAKVPRIAAEHLLGLNHLRRELDVRRRRAALQTGESLSRGR